MRQIFIISLLFFFFQGTSQDIAYTTKHNVVNEYRHSVFNYASGRFEKGDIAYKAPSAVTYTWRYYTKAVLGSTANYLVGMPSDSLTNSNKRVTYLMEPGSGETGGANNTEANARKYGWARDLYLGLWDGGIVQSNGYEDSVVYPIIIVAQRATSTNSAPHNFDKWQKVISDYSAYIDTNQIHLGGISLGGKNALYMLASSTYAYHFFTTNFLASPGGKSPQITDSTANFQEYVDKGGIVLMSTGINDNAGAYKVGEILPYFNAFVPGSGKGENWVTGVNGFTNDTHCCWDTLFKYNRTYPWINNKTLYGETASYTKAPKAIAQTVINTDKDTTHLNGVTNGWYRDVSWEKISGAGTIVSPSSDTTVVTGLSGTSVFKLTVTNTSTLETAEHTVTVNAPTARARYIYRYKTYSKIILE